MDKGWALRDEQVFNSQRRCESCIAASSLTRNVATSQTRRITPSSARGVELVNMQRPIPATPRRFGGRGISGLKITLCSCWRR